MSDQLRGVRVLSLESRREADMRRLIEKRGGVAISAPSMKEVPMADQSAALEFADDLMAGRFQALILLSGGGTRKLIEAASQRLPLTQLTDKLRSIPLLCRGPKPVAVLRQHGLRPELVAPEPNTSDDLLNAIDASPLRLQGLRIAVQEYGQTNTQLLDALRARGAEPTPILVYAWQMPDDTEPLENAVHRLSNREVDAALFTSARQVVHLLTIADRLSLRSEAVSALNTVVVASVGPVTSAALRQAGVRVSTEPDHPKMGTLVAHLAKNWATGFGDRLATP